MATSFLETAGTNGFIATPFNLLTTELNTLANGSSATSSVGGTSEVFTQTNYANAQKCQIYFTSGGAFTPTGASYFQGWFLFSPDNGTSYETAALITRNPDFIIPLAGSAFASTNIALANGVTRVPWWTNKVYLTNNSGVSLPASGNTLKAGPVADQY